MEDERDSGSKNQRMWETKDKREEREERREKREEREKWIRETN